MTDRSQHAVGYILPSSGLFAKQFEER